MAEPRYLIGGGEQLSEEVSRPKRGSGPKAHPYDFYEARRRLTPQWQSTVGKVRSLPELACPDGDTVFSVTLHPSYLAKSYYPSQLINEIGLRHVGSRAAHLVPEKITGAQGKAGDERRPFPAPELFLAGARDRLDAFVSQVGDWMPVDEDLIDEYRRLERVDPLGGRFRSSPTQPRRVSGTPVVAVEAGSSPIV